MTLESNDTSRFLRVQLIMCPIVCLAQALIVLYLKLIDAAPIWLTWPVAFALPASTLLWLYCIVLLDPAAEILGLRRWSILRFLFQLLAIAAISVAFTLLWRTLLV